jgi:hypothetical protein
MVYWTMLLLYGRFELAQALQRIKREIINKLNREMSAEILRITDWQEVSMRVFLAEENETLRDKMRKRIAAMQGVALCGEGSSLDETLHELRNLRPDVVVLGLSLAATGAGILRTMKWLSPRSRLIVLAHEPGEGYRRACYYAGAEEVLDRRKDLENLEHLLI